MFKYLVFLPYVGAAALAVGVLGLMLSRRKRPQPQSCEAAADWRPTGKIDFAENAGTYYLQSEEYRLFQSLSDTKRVEVRWRRATLEEAKRVASLNNTRAAILDLALPEPIRRPPPAPTPPHEELSQAGTHTPASSGIDWISNRSASPSMKANGSEN